MHARLLIDRITDHSDDSDLYKFLIGLGATDIEELGPEECAMAEVTVKGEPTLIHAEKERDGFRVFRIDDEGTILGPEDGVLNPTSPDELAMKGEFWPLEGT